MNKYQEALHKLTKHIDFPNSPQRAFDSSKDEPRKYYIALQELVDKATPKKVIRKPVKHYVDFYCPSCKRKLSSRTTYHFCPKKDCGQALDWGDDK